MAHNSSQLTNILRDGNYLLAYAIEAGIEVESDTAKRIMSADKQGEPDRDGSEAGLLVAAISSLASKVRPVTAESLRACREEARHAIRIYEVIVCLLALILLPASIVTAVYNGINNKINVEINEANEIALQLHTSASSATDKISKLQQLAVSARTIRSLANQLGRFNVARMSTAIDAPDKVELSPDLSADNEDLIKEQIHSITDRYQNVRLYARETSDNTAIWFGAISTAVLPIFYALLGACAAVLRAFSQQIESRTFNYSYASPARFIIAAIGGGVIGLFNFTIGDGATVPPLAVAFLVGYSTDLFFSFLEGSLPHSSKTASSNRISQPSPK
jgi:hypothetical protein